jgi:hypothetical protein
LLGYCEVLIGSESVALDHDRMHALLAQHVGEAVEQAGRGRLEDGLARVEEDVVRQQLDHEAAAADRGLHAALEALARRARRSGA